MSFTTLVSTAALDMHLGDANIVVVDCRFRLDDTGWGEREYAHAHIPGAVYAHLDRQLSGATNGSNGRHPLPPPDALAETFGRLGIASGIQVFAYDQDNGMYASRLWWLLRWMGHDAVAVVDGGMARWTAEGRTVEGGVVTPTARHFSGSPHADMTLDASDVAAALRDGGWRLVDARAPERYRGEVEPIDRVAGHIPGAINHPYLSNMSADGLLRTPEDLREHLRPVTDRIEPGRIVCYCGSGVSACHNLLALEHAGIHGAKLYSGSWSEWSSDPRRPVETSV